MISGFFPASQVLGHHGTMCAMVKKIHMVYGHPIIRDSFWRVYKSLLNEFMIIPQSGYIYIYHPTSDYCTFKGLYQSRLSRPINFQEFSICFFLLQQTLWHKNTQTQGVPVPGHTTGPLGRPTTKTLSVANQAVANTTCIRSSSQRGVFFKFHMSWV